ncbi:MAG: hypothetical protein HY923_06535 [Elusimicrobia bacterium]|nr:hypothetical protein [Elusimicrobiota bacterium]
MKNILLAAVLTVLGAPAWAGLLTGQGVSLVDSTGGQRSTFSNNEKLGVSVQVNNGIASLNRIAFQFDIVAPDGATTFRHAGNAVPGTVGNSAAQVNGLPVSGFFRGPGVYTLKAMATLDGVTLTQTVTFTVSSPNILLIYPPNGSVDLSDNPLNFQWFSSGATSYRVTVADNPSLYNAPFIQTTAGAPSLTYPQNPTDPRQRLAAGQLYYWGVEGLDLNGNVIARSEVASSFSMRAAALTRDLAVTAITATGPAAADGSIPFRITVADQGGTAETGVQLSFTLGGLAAPGAPLIMPAFTAGESKDFNLPAAMPADQNSSLAIACVQLFDDNVPNNCKTLTVTRASSGAGAGTGFGSGELTAEQIWAAIRELLRERGIDLDDYSVIGMEGSLTRAELLSLLEQLRNGSATAVVSGPPVVSAPPSSTAGPYIPPASKKEAPLPPDAPAEDAESLQEWKGMTEVAGKANRSFTISSAAVWKKLWSALSDQKLPAIDFKKEMIVGIIGGKEERADTIAVDGVQQTLNGLLVRYRLVVHKRHLEIDGPKRAAKRSTVPYVLRVVPRNSLQVNFELVKENTDD